MINQIIACQRGALPRFQSPLAKGLFLDRIDAMHAFIKVVETGSFTKAADVLHISRTSATQLVQQLEAHLRVSLLHRTTRTITLTQAGSLYYEQAVQWLDGLHRLESDLPHLQGSPKGRLRVNVPAPLASMVLAPPLAISLRAILALNCTWE